MSDNNNIDPISFSVDAGLIDRLGRELVGKAETAVSELVKNSYDADATTVDVEFINPNIKGGTLRITDNGLGMTLDQLKLGFMTISSTDKVHNPQSIRFKRSKAGKKGIGRFATQRLGEKLTIITQTKSATKAIKIEIDWNSYKIDTDISSIQNFVEEIDKIQEEGTVLIIEKLREGWTEKAIERVFRYVSDLLQPDYLSDRSKNLGLAKQKDSSFKVKFTSSIDGVEKTIADPNKMVFNKALAIIEGYVDKDHDAYCTVKSNSLKLSDDVISIEYGKNQKKYNNLSDVHFKVYYFIYNREEYYTNVSSLELRNIRDISRQQGGVRLYRNGFRVLPYGESNDDWLNINARYYNESGTNVPFGNPNLFGFVEIIDPEGVKFNETASREGLVENDSFLELQDFLHKSLEACRNRIRFAVEVIKKPKKKIVHNDSGEVQVDKTPIEKLDEFQKMIDGIAVNNEPAEEKNKHYQEDTKKVVQELKQDFEAILHELGMLRVLAGLGLTIGEFTHEVIQFSPSMNGDLSVLGNQKLDIEGVNSLENLRRTIRLFISYTSYFNATVSANVSRELKPQELDIVVNHFREIIDADLKKLKIEFNIDTYGFDLITLPMHSSEWSSILFNLYTNSKKAIKRKFEQEEKGRIGIILGKEKNKVYLEFLDNGDGIPEGNKERIFDAFFTTSSPVGFEASQDDKLTGTGLGLKIIRDIIHTYGGTIEVIPAEQNYSTCIRIEVPLASEKQKEQYDL